MMLRKHLIATIGAAGIAFAAASATAADIVEGPSVTWHLSTWGPSRGQTAGIEKLSELLKERTGGNFQLNIAFAEQLAPAKEGLDSIKIGVIEAAQISTSYHPGKNPALTALDLPFLPIEDDDVRIAVHEAFYRHPAAQKELESWGAMYYASAILPVYEFMGVGEPPRTLEGWKGKRVRALGGMGDAMRILGAVPTTVPAPEVYTGLERRMFDAAAFPFTYAHASYRLHEIADWYTHGLAVGAANVVTVVSKSAWDALPQQYQDLLMELKEPHYEALKEAYKAADEKNLPMFQEAGVEAIEIDEEQRKELIERAAKPVWDQWVEEMEGKSIPGRELVQLILDEAEKAKK